MWHMHQPYYRYPGSAYYILPWVRLHCVKDYYGMARVVDKFEKVKTAFNFSGVLLEQILDYAQNRAQDYYSILSLKSPSTLTQDEKNFILNRFFSINFERFIRPNPRYIQLYNKKISLPQKFTAHDFSDLQAIFNLCWFHPYTVQEDKGIGELIARGKDYTKDDRQYIIDKQYEIIAQTIPLYKKLLCEGRIEITVTPYHHPIMPLINDTDVVREFPYMKKPAHRFSYPQDCHWHLKEAKNVFSRAFEREVSGSWPSEGSVSEPVTDIYTQEGFNWIATDEGILFKSLTTDTVPYDMIKNQRHLIYRPYNFRDLNIFFRDRNLSDIISFTYQGWEDPVFAANDLLEHFKKIHYHVKDMFKDSIIPVIMDGENAWEYYQNNAVEFLETIYSALEKSHILSTSTPSEFLKGYQPKSLDRLASGSWINGDFGVWAGSAKNNSYWDMLKKIKDMAQHADISEEKKEEVRKYIYLIEGSDWFWWNTFDDVIGEFKNIFAAYIDKIHQLLGKEAPVSHGG